MDQVAVSKDIDIAPLEEACDRLRDVLMAHGDECGCRASDSDIKVDWSENYRTNRADVDVICICTCGWEYQLRTHSGFEAMFQSVEAC